MAKWKLGHRIKCARYFSLTHSETSMGATKTSAIANVYQSDNGSFIVEPLIDRTSTNMKKIWGDTVREINHYIIELNEKDVFGYLIYHCKSASNLYSDIRWTYIEKND